MTHDECKDTFPELFYRELGPAESAASKEHMAACPACADAYRRLEAALSLMDRRERDEPSPAEWVSSLARLEERLGIDTARHADGARRTASVFHVRFAWAAGIAAILLVGVGIYLGRTILTLPTDHSAVLAGGTPPPAGTAADSLATRTESYLERSKVLLQGIVNEDESLGSTGTIERQRRVSRELIGEAHVLTAALRQPDQQQVRELIADLQIILLQLANIEVEPGKPAIELVKQGVDHRSILLKIRVEELKALTRRTSTASAADSVKTHL